MPVIWINVHLGFKLKSSQTKVFCSSTGFIFFFSINPLPDDKILDRSKLKQIADDILK